MEEEKKEKKKISYKTTLKQLLKTYQYSKKSKKYLILFLIGNILLSIISVLVPIIGAKRIVALTNSTFKQLVWCIVVIFILEIARNIVRVLSNLSVNKYYLNIVETLRIELSKETLKIKIDDINKNTSGVFIERINQDTDEVSDIFAVLIDYLTSVITSLGVFISVFFINKVIFFLYLIFIIILAILSKKASNAMHTKRKIRKKNNEKVSGFISEIVHGAKDIKILNAESSFLDKTQDLIEEAKKINYDGIKTNNKWRLVNGSVRDTLDLCISIAIAVFTCFNELSIANALIIYNYNYRIISIADDIGFLLDYWKRYQLASDRIFGIIDGNEFNKETFGTKELNDYKGNIRFDKVNFSYEDNQQILKDMSFDIKANQTVAFVGKSGAGKSTIFNLISKLYDNYDGNIYFDDENISDLSKSAIRGNLSIISQNPYIYNLSIKENLEIINNKATMEDIKRVCKLACLDDFIESLPEKYDTIVGEGGVTLSGGQRQRLAIARALLQNTKLILFDEATSALDNETQSKIQEAIHNLKGDYTIIIIAHRLSTVKDSDCIYVVDDGKIADYGSENELLQKSKVFQTLYNKELEK